jgi:hypothetical protein|nr:MAG TPA: hypothetical protein [Caudoviricetes sp.]
MSRFLSEDEKIKALKAIKFDLEERKFPFFEEDEIAFLLEKNLNIIDLAVYDGLIKKARVDSIKLPSGLEKPNNREYWLNLANVQKEKILAGIKAGIYADVANELLALGFTERKKGGFMIMKRADEI